MWDMDPSHTKFYFTAILKKVAHLRLLTIANLCSRKYRRNEFGKQLIFYPISAIWLNTITPTQHTIRWKICLRLHWPASTLLYILPEPKKSANTRSKPNTTQPIVRFGGRHQSPGKIPAQKQNLSLIKEIGLVGWVIAENISKALAQKTLVSLHTWHTWRYLSQLHKLAVHHHKRLSLPCLWNIHHY